MKTTVEIPEELLRAAKAKAALEGRSLKDLVADGLRLMLQRGSGAALRRVSFPLIPCSPETPKVTAEDVSRAEERMLEEEAGEVGKFMRR